MWIRSLVPALLVVAGACSPSAPATARDDSHNVPDAPESGESHRFDPAQVRVGDTIAGLVVAAADLMVSEIDSAYVGSVQFSGELVVSGTHRALYDDPEPSLICFFVDRESAGRVPRMLNDERMGWFCFENAAEAERLLGPADDPGAATVVISDYRTVRQFTDAFDTARLLRVVERSASPR